MRVCVLLKQRRRKAQTKKTTVARCSEAFAFYESDAINVVCTINISARNSSRSFLSKNYKLTSQRFPPLTNARFVLVDWPQSNRLILARFVGVIVRIHSFLSNVPLCSSAPRGKKIPGEIDIDKKEGR